MNREIKDIAMWEETDSELAKYSIQSLSSLIKNQEEQLKANDLMINEMINRINKALEYIKDMEGFELEDYKLREILKGRDNITISREQRLMNRIDKAIEYCEDITSREIDISDTDYDLGQDFTARDILHILRGEDIKEIPQFEGTLEQLDKLSIRGIDNEV